MHEAINFISLTTIVESWSFQVTKCTCLESAKLSGYKNEVYFVDIFLLKTTVSFLVKKSGSIKNYLKVLLLHNGLNVTLSSIQVLNNFIIP